MKTKLAGDASDKRLMLWCPGCDEPHGPRVEGTDPWTWNNDREKPTLTPSVLVTDHAGNICHSFVNDGRIQFLGDCTHALAGQTVDIPDWPDHWGVNGE